MIVIYTKTEEETISLGEQFSKILDKGSVVTLTGDLGTGKTHFVKGLAKGLGIKSTITSPTFNIFNTYNENNICFNHFDVYRVHDEDEILDIGFDDYVYSDSISVIEWAELIKSILPEDKIDILIEKINNDTERKITFNFSNKYKEKEAIFNDNISSRDIIK